MLDLKAILADPDAIKANAELKGDKCDVDAIVRLAEELRQLKTDQQTLKTELNKVNKALGPVLGMLKGGKTADDPKLAGALKKVGQIDAFDELADLDALVAKGADAVQEAMRQASDRVKDFDPKLADTQAALDREMALVPNLCDATAPAGETEEDNVVVSTHGKTKTRQFTPKPHWEVAEALGLFHTETAAKLAGSGFTMITGALARLEWALLTWFLDRAVDAGYTPTMVPFLANEDVMFGTGQLPKFHDDLYRLDDRDRYYLIPTAEAPLTSIHAGEILQADDLPKHYTAYTPCFRREAGAAGKDTRGLLRVHQFNKVELFKLVHPDHWREEHEALLENAKALLADLGLHFRVVELCKGDLSFGATKCWDLEVYAPGIDQWLEVSSVSHFADFQARRANIRFKEGKGKPTFCHTINGSGLATPRTMVAIIETFQKKDGTIEIPKVLRPYMHDQATIK